jgi:urea carboxylase-associated protein 2
MLDLNNLTPAEYRARYEDLQAAARAVAAATPVAPAAGEIDEAAVIKRESIPPGWYVALRLARGDAIRITNPAGTPGAALFLWNADEVSERYCAGDTLKLQWTTNLTTGRVLFSDMGRVLASITADSGAGHDSVVGPNGPVQAGAGRNGRENLRSAAAKFGLTRRDVGPAMSLFSAVRTDEQGRLHLQPTPEGGMVEFRAEMNLLVALSNTPHALAASPEATGVIEFVTYHAPPPGPDDFCRTFTAEAKRGFINTDEVFAP